MAKRDNEGLVGRRAFLKGATLAGAGALAAPLTAPGKAEAQDVAPPARAPSIPAAPDREAERGTPADVQAITQSSSGADFILD
ncbi:MAG: twin-arginine translocation signal domain-containing protein, partial [Rhizomicrobium sp.]